MKLTNQLLRSRSARPLNTVEYLDLSNLDLVSLERLELCPKLQTVNLRNNCLEAVSNLDCCSHLWKVDLANNKIKSLEGFSQFSAFGTVSLSNNDLEWNELQKIRHLHILDLSLHGNPQLEEDVYYRMHVIDSLPLVWMLDGRLITSAERNQVEQFFKESSFSNRPVRHKLPASQFIPSSLKNIMVTGVFGQKTEHLMRRFPVKETLNIDMDNRRLSYLAYNFQQEFNLQKKYRDRTSKPSQLIENLLNYRKEDQHRCNMLFLMLVATLEFAIPASVVQNTLAVAKLSKIGNIAAMELFLLSREDRCRVVSLLLGAVKIERDQNIDGGLYNRLYLCLYDLVSDLVKLANGESISKYQDERKKLDSDSRKSVHRSLLASEVVQLLCIVPAFFDFIGKDAGVMDLIRVATRDIKVSEKIRSLSWKVQYRGGSWKEVYELVAELLIGKVKEANFPFSLTGSHSKQRERTADTQKIEPSYTITSKKVVKELSRLHTSEKRSGVKHGRAATAVRVRERDLTAKPRRQRAKTALVRKPVLGDRVQIGNQMFGRIVGIPENRIALVQLETFTGPKFKQVDYMGLSSKQLDHQFVYEDLENVVWNSANGCWFNPDFHRETRGKDQPRIPKKSFLKDEKKFCFLSEAIGHNLKLRVEIPSAEKEEDVPVSPFLGKTVITDHVRSIVKECLEQAEIKWSSKNDSEAEETPFENKTAWEETDSLKTLELPSEEAANVDLNPANEYRRLEEESTETSGNTRICYLDEGLTSAGEGLSKTDVIHRGEDEEDVRIIGQDGEPKTPMSDHEDELVSGTENARLDKWRKAGAMSKISNSPDNSRVSSATDLQSLHSNNKPPPQRPSTPLMVKTIPIKKADTWLAGGKDINKMSVKHLSAPLPGWMEGLEITCRPKSFPVYGKRPTLRSAGSCRRPPSQRTALKVRPRGGPASVHISGQPPPAYIRIHSERFLSQRR